MLRPALLFLPALLLYAASAAMGADDKPSKSPNPAGKDEKVAVDPVTEAVRQDILTQLRIAAIAFNDPEDQGEALSGIVGAFLKHGRVKDALIDFKVINTPLWKAHALRRTRLFTLRDTNAIRMASPRRAASSAKPQSSSRTRSKDAIKAMS
jgi:hypothetical protein